MVKVRDNTTEAIITSTDPRITSLPITPESTQSNPKQAPPRLSSTYLLPPPRTKEFQNLGEQKGDGERGGGQAITHAIQQEAAVYKILTVRGKVTLTEDPRALSLASSPLVMGRRGINSNRTKTFSTGENWPGTQKNKGRQLTLTKREAGKKIPLAFHSQTGNKQTRGPQGRTTPADEGYIRKNGERQGGKGRW
ncbi:hypothetical protein RRG08_035725 [Elysia crispata]|uniref:Uncharacterized protein n=1 Tax=Elysia crispata TaxID=231223 RepID=A0AAE0YIH8_9GAST|nr:hypothetical protein RRG08_035725 [Elysia crispata]